MSRYDILYVKTTECLHVAVVEIPSSSVHCTEPSSKRSNFVTFLQIDWLDFLQTVFRDSGVRLTSEHEVYIGGSSLIKYILQLFKDSDSRLLGTCRGPGGRG